MGIVAIGHSGIAGTNSDPGRPFEDVPANSWATGSNPARGGAEAAALRSQAEAALERVPAPRLLVIQTADNDVRCDGSDEEHVLRFGEHLADALRVVVPRPATATPTTVAAAAVPALARADEPIHARAARCHAPTSSPRTTVRPPPTVARPRTRERAGPVGPARRAWSRGQPSSNSIGLVASDLAAVLADPLVV